MDSHSIDWNVRAILHLWLLGIPRCYLACSRCRRLAHLWSYWIWCSRGPRCRLIGHNCDVDLRECLWVEVAQAQTSSDYTWVWIFYHLGMSYLAGQKLSQDENLLPNQVSPCNWTVRGQLCEAHRLVPFLQRWLSPTSVDGSQYLACGDTWCRRRVALQS